MIAAFNRCFATVALVTLLSACGLTAGQDTCTPENCPAGCCADGACVAGTGLEACGSAGNRCDVCLAGQQCSAGHCVSDPTGGGTCHARSDATLCAELGRFCGGLKITDECNTARDIASCGTCASPAACTADGTCGCVGETDAELCASNAAACGTLQVYDRCGALRTVASCGGCSAPKTCTGNQCACVPETAAQLCAAAGKTCGALATTDRCGKSVTVSNCGTCANPTVCSAAGQCACPGETDAQFCTRLGRACGSATGTDVCGRSRTVTSCGTCAGTNTCTTGVCACPAETTAAFCLRQGSACGPTSGTDLCGNPKSVASCGSCSGVNTCGGGTTPKTCGCTPQSDAAFCTAKGKECGTLTGVDNCGLTRTATCVGTCTQPQTCGGGSTANVCGCTTENDTQFCTRLGKNCDLVTAPDNCGAARTTTCGTCPSLQTCAGAGLANVCGCTGESNAQFCTRLGKACGSYTGTDLCGLSRTADCGATCPAMTVCGGGGVANACGGRVEPMLPVCGGGFCWDNPLPVGVGLSAVKTSPSGSNWVVGDSGTVLQWDGSTWRGWFAVVPTRLTAVWPFSDTDVWAAGVGGVILHYNGTAWSPVGSNTTRDLTGLWGAPNGTLWAVGSGVVLKRPTGGAFAAQTLPVAAQTTALSAVFGIGTDVWVVGNLLILRWDGSAWSTTSAPYALTDVWGSSATDIWAVSSSGVMRYTGAGWVPSTATTGRAVTGTSSTNVWVIEADTTVSRFDGLSWKALKMVTITGGAATKIYGVAARATDGTALAVGTAGALYRYDGANWFRVNKGVSPFTPNFTFTTNDVYVSGTASTMVGTSTEGSGTSYYPYYGAGAIARCDGGPCTRSTTGPKGTIFRVSGSPTSAAWALGGFIDVYNLAGASVPAVCGPSVFIQLWAVAPVTDSDVWVVGEDKTIHLDGSSWTVVPNPVSGTSTTLESASAWATNQVWAAGSSGTLLRYNGSNWSGVVSGTATDITELRATGATTALLGGSFGVISCANVTCTPTLQTASITGLWAESPSTFWVIEAGKAKRWAGSVAQPMTQWDVPLLGRVSGAGTKAVVMGFYGELLHQQ